MLSDRLGLSLMKRPTGCIGPNGITVDVEDYFHASAFRTRVPFESWPQMPGRVVPNTRRVLELLAEFDASATFFILGWVAERYPSLVREIQSAGHELGCHSYAHRLLYEMTPAEFRDDTRRALSAIEDAAGVAVRSYRAPSFSITEQSLWALEILLELGFVRDSSIFPIRNRFYGMPTAPRQPFKIRIQGNDLAEFPPATLKIGSWTIPLTGGAYLRLLPYRFQARGLSAMASRAEPIVLYFHPWELDPDQPRLPGASGSRIYHYAGLARTEGRLRRILKSFAFGKLSQLAQAAAIPAYKIAVSSRVRPNTPVLIPLAPR
jgi:polysaccharide deacetylase family protein (PEP-CTERM system associated)